MSELVNANLMRRALAVVAAAALAVAGSIATAPPAQAVDPWARFAFTDCETATQCVSASFQTVKCHAPGSPGAISVRWYWPDRATRYLRVENNWDGKQRYAFPENQSVDVRIQSVQTGWNMLHVWTPGHGERDLDAVAYVPAC